MSHKARVTFLILEKQNRGIGPKSRQANKLQSNLKPCQTSGTQNDKKSKLRITELSRGHKTHNAVTFTRQVLAQTIKFRYNFMHEKRSVLYAKFQLNGAKSHNNLVKCTHRTGVEKTSSFLNVCLLKNPTLHQSLY